MLFADINISLTIHNNNCVNIVYEYCGHDEKLDKK